MSETALAYTSTIIDSGRVNYANRILIGTPVTGLVRIEWVQARYGQVIPVNWSSVNLHTFMSSLFPLRYQVAEAQNIIVKKAVEDNFEWCLLYEHDNIPGPDAFIRLNAWMQRGDVPVVSGLYYTRSIPCEPLIFRGDGTGAFYDWKMGDEVWCDRVPTGFLLIHGSILRAMYEDAEPYLMGNQQLRRVFNSPRDAYFDSEKGAYVTSSGTSDLDWCKRLIDGRYFERAGWPDIQARQWPLCVDTNLKCLHINPDGQTFPPGGFPK